VRRLLIIGFLAMIACSAGFAQEYLVTHTIPLGGNGAWDYLRADTESRRLYVSHSANVDVLDLDTGQEIGKLTGFGFIHGIVIVKALNTGFLSDGQKNEVISFDPATLKIKGRIKTLANPNSMVYDRSSGRLFVGHKPSKSVTVIRASSGEIEKVIPLGGVPEFPVSDGAGSIFINIDDQSEIIRIDANSMTIKARWPLKPCQSPSGLAFDEQKNRLFSACENKLMAVMDAGTGELISTLPIGDGPDAAAFDPETRLAFSSNGDGTLTVIAEHGAGYAVVQNLRTEVGARTMTLDMKNHGIYLSTAKLGPPPAPTPENPNPPKHPTAVAGTFHLIVATPIASR
jgi:hypothetical protein